MAGMQPERTDEAYRSWERSASRPGRSPFLGTAVLRIAPWACVLAFIVLSARMEPRWTRAYERSPAFGPTTITVVLWVAVVLAWLALVIGVRRWRATGYAADHNRKWSSTVVLLSSLAGLLAWWVWQLASTLKGWGSIFRSLTVGRDNYADRFPVLMLAPILLIGLAGAVGLVTYLRPRRRADMPDNPYRSA